MKVEFVKAVKFESKSGEYFYYVVVNDKLPFLGGETLPKCFFVGFDYGEKLIANKNNIHKGYDKEKDREFLYIPKPKTVMSSTDSLDSEDYIPF